MAAELDAERDSWGRWGKDDERGALNLLDADTVLAATSCCRSGKIYPLGLPITRSGMPTVEYRGPAQRLTLLDHSDGELLESYGAQEGVGSHEDLLILGSHSGTHMDALVHVFKDSAIYNGFPHDEMRAHAGARHCGIDKAGPIATRGVLIDVAAAKGVDCLEPAYVITAADISDALELHDLQLRAGDAAIVRTGWLEQFLATGREMTYEQPGIGVEAARFIASHDVTVIGADNTAVEAMPFDGGQFLAVHVETLNKRGIYLIEHLLLTDLCRDRCHEFLFVAAPLPVVGATASPVNPVAIG